MAKYLLILLLLAGCTTTTHYGKRPPMELLDVGMSRDQVIAIMGDPEKVAAKDGTVYLLYGWDSPWDGKVGAAEEYFVRLIDGKVDAFGELGDFDSVQRADIVIDIE